MKIIMTKIKININKCWIIFWVEYNILGNKKDLW